MKFLAKTSTFVYSGPDEEVLYGPYDTQEAAEAAAWRVNAGQDTQVTVVSVEASELTGLHIQVAPAAGHAEPLSAH